MKRANHKEPESNSNNNEPSTTKTKSKKSSAESKKSTQGFSSLISLLLLILGVFAVSFLLTDTFTFGIDQHALLTHIVPVRVAEFFHPTAAAVPTLSATSVPIAATNPSPNDIHKTSAGSGGKRKLVTLTEAELRQYDGSDPAKPVYVAINGKVYDVTAGKKHYGKGGGYSFFSGVDAARAYITGCFQTHLTHDLRGLTEDQINKLEKIQDLQHWVDFFEKHPKYFYVGQVIHDPIPDDTPLPEPCR